MQSVRWVGLTAFPVLLLVLAGCDASTLETEQGDPCKEAAELYRTYGAIRSAQATAGRLLRDNIRSGSDIGQELSRYDQTVGGLDEHAGGVQELAHQAGQNCGLSVSGPDYSH